MYETFADEAKTDEEIDKYLNELMKYYDQRIKYFNGKGFVLGRKGTSWLKYKLDERRKNPIEGDELRLLRKYLRTRNLNLPWLFLSERGGPLSRHTVIYTIDQAAKKAGLEHVTPHMLRHGCGYYLANKGYDLRLIQDYLGHRDPKHTARYTRTASVRFTGLWGNKA